MIKVTTFKLCFKSIIVSISALVSQWRCNSKVWQNSQNSLPRWEESSDKCRPWGTGPKLLPHLGVPLLRQWVGQAVPGGRIPGCGAVHGWMELRGGGASSSYRAWASPAWGLPNTVRMGATKRFVSLNGKSYMEKCFN